MQIDLGNKLYEYTLDPRDTMENGHELHNQKGLKLSDTVTLETDYSWQSVLEKLI